MKCQDAQLLIMEYLDGELPEADKVRLDEHLAACEACSRELEAQRRLIEGVRSLPKVDAPKGFAAEVRQAIEKENRPRSQFSIFIARYGALAASIVIAIIGLSIYAQQQDSPNKENCDTCKIYDPEVIASADAQAAQRPEKEQRFAAEPAAGVAQEKTATIPEVLQEGYAKENTADKNAVSVNFDVTIQAANVQTARRKVVDFLQERGANVVAEVSAADSVIISARVPQSEEMQKNKDAAEGKEQTVATRSELLRELANSSFGTIRSRHVDELADSGEKPDQMGVQMAQKAGETAPDRPICIRIVPIAIERPMLNLRQQHK